jgi:hypothetical protein
LVFALNSEEDVSLDWALKVLALKSYKSDFVLQPIYGVLESLLTQLQKRWEVLASSGESIDNDPFNFFSTHANEINFIHRASTIFRNLSFVEQNAKYFATHTGFVGTILEFLRSKDRKIFHDSVEIVTNICEYFSLNSSIMEYISSVLQLLYSNDLSIVVLVLALFVKLTASVENYKFFASMITVEFFKRLEVLLFLGHEEIDSLRDYSLDILINFARLGSMRMRLQMVQQTNLVKILMGFLNSKFSLETIDKAATILQALAPDPKHKECFLLYEEYLIELSISNNQLSKYAVDILVELSELH